MIPRPDTVHGIPISNNRLNIRGVSNIEIYYLKLERHARCPCGCHVVRLLVAGESTSVRGVGSWDPAGEAICVCLDVNEGGTNRNRCTQRLVILHAQIVIDLLPDLLYFTLQYFTLHCAKVSSHSMKKCTDKIP